MLVCYRNCRKSFFTTYFHDLLHGNTWGYRGLKGVTGGYNGLQGVTGGYKGLQGLTNYYRNLFLARTLLDTVSWFILHKNQR